MSSSEFKRLIVPMSRKLFNFAHIMLKDQAEAEDAVQEVCLKLWNMRDKMKEVKNPEAYTMRMIKNLCLDRIKAKKPVCIDNYHAGLEQQDGQKNPQEVLENADMLQQFTRLLNELPEQQRSIFQLREMEDLEYEEIAEIMGMNINAIRVNLSRARSKLREELLKIRVYG